MSNDAPTIRLPKNARDRELIAVRYASRLGRKNGAWQHYKDVNRFHDEYISAAEVIGLIAYGRPTALIEEIPALRQNFFETWRSPIGGEKFEERQYPLVRNMRWVIARVKWWQRSKHRSIPFAPSNFRPLPPDNRMQVRLTIRLYGGTAASTLTELRAAVRSVFAADAKIEQARSTLCAALSAGQIEAMGIPGVWFPRTEPINKVHESIPARFFINHENTIRDDGWVLCGANLWAAFSGVSGVMPLSGSQRASPCRWVAAGW